MKTIAATSKMFPRVHLKHWYIFLAQLLQRSSCLNPRMTILHLPFMHFCLLNVSLVNELFWKRLFKITHTLNSRTAVCIQILWKGTSQVLGVGTGQTAWSALAALSSPASCPHTLPSKQRSSAANWLTKRSERKSIGGEGGGDVNKYFINWTSILKLDLPNFNQICSGSPISC